LGWSNILWVCQCWQCPTVQSGRGWVKQMRWRRWVAMEAKLWFGLNSIFLFDVHVFQNPWLTLGSNVLQEGFNVFGTSPIANISDTLAILSIVLPHYRHIRNLVRTNSISYAYKKFVPGTEIMDRCVSPGDGVCIGSHAISADLWQFRRLQESCRLTWEIF
jgi:hypothetical protein